MFFFPVSEGLIWNLKFCSMFGLWNFFAFICVSWFFFLLDTKTSVWRWRQRKRKKARWKEDEKRLIGSDFIHHDVLVQLGSPRLAQIRACWNSGRCARSHWGGVIYFTSLCIWQFGSNNITYESCIFSENIAERLQDSGTLSSCYVTISPT